MESKSRTESDETIKHVETLGGEYIFQATSAAACSLCRLSNRTGALPSLHCIFRLFRHLGIQNTLQRGSFNDFLFKEQLCQLFSDDNIREKPFLCERFELTITDRLKSRRSEKALQSKKQGDHDVASRRRLLFLQAKIRQMKSTRASVVTN
jgi:hypothetical protein